MESYEGSVVENTKGVEVMRMKALDADEEFSDNWLAEFEIESGNEGGYFRIETDAKTNEGILILQKEIDYEEIQSLALTVVVRNKAAFHTSITSSSYSLILKHILVKINVKNEPEGPKFSPKVKVIPISEETSKVVLSKVIAKYPAIDADSGKIAERVKYVKKYDLDNWLIIDPKTGDIKLAKVPDRESKFLVNGTYTAEILAITDDLPAKTATGTVAIQVEDFNDHCPTLTSTSTDMCSNDKSVIVTAVDEDADPNSVPFKYKIVDEPEVPALLSSMDISGKGGSGMKASGFGESAMHTSTSNFVGSAEQIQRIRRPVAVGYDLVGSGYGSGYEAEWQHYKRGSVDAFEGVALPEAYLEQYYVEKANYVLTEGHLQKDAMLVYDYEGQESPVGSIGSCSFIEEDLDQSFLNELGPKFKTLAEICRGTEMTSGVSVKQPSVAGQHTTVSTNSAITNNCVVTNKTIEVTSPVPALQVQKNVVVTENVSPPQPTVYIQKNVVVSDPGYVQQPVYYATNPVIQTTRYIVEPQIQRNVMIERSSVPGLQGHLLMSDIPSTQNVMVTQKRLVHGSDIQGGMVVGLDQGTLRTSEMPSSQNVLLLENRGFDQGSMRFNEPVSQNVVLTGKRVVSGHNVQGGMMGYELGSLHRNVMPGSQNVIVTEKTVVSGSTVQGGLIG
ncbi:UNVERIFIED_CONTAM: hypothetical protein FKN15_040422 [Acipenser sinensis]